MYFLKQLIVVATFFCFTEFDFTLADDWIDNPEVELPPAMIICKRYDPNRDECIKKSIQSLLPTIIDGYEPLGLSSIDPLIIPVIHFQYNAGENLQLRMSYKNASIRGFGSTHIKNVRSKLNDTSLHLELDLFHPFMDMEALYRGQGNLFGFQYKSKGYGNFSFGKFSDDIAVSYNGRLAEGVSATWKMDGDIETRNGEEYVKISKFDTRPRMKSVKIYATGLLPDPDLNELAVQFVNQVWDQLYERIYVQTKQIWEPIATSSVNIVFGRVPLRRLMPKD